MGPLRQNECWKFSGQEGLITFNLKDNIEVGSIALQAMKKSVSFDWNHSPKVFEAIVYPKDQPQGVQVGKAGTGKRKKKKFTFFKDRLSITLMESLLFRGLT